MQLEQLKYLVEVKKTMSISKAAKNLFVSQPAITKSLKKLQTEYDIILYNSHRDGIIFTEIGEKAVQRSKQIIAEIEELEKDLIEYKKMHISREDLKATLSIYSPPSFIEYIFPDVISLLKKRHPNIILQINPIYEKQVYEAYPSDSFDLAFTFWDDELLSEHPQLEQLGKRHFSTLPVYIAMDAEHPLCKKECIDISDLEEYSCITNFLSKQSYNGYNSLFRKLKLNPIMQTNNMNVAFETLIHTNYLFLTTKLASKHPYIKSGEVVLKLLGYENDQYSLGCIYFNNSDKIEFLELFMDCLVDYLNHRQCF